MKTSALLLLPALIIPAALMSSCTVPMALGAGAAAGYVGLQERPTKQVAADTQIKVMIKDKLAQAKFDYLTDIGIDVYYNDVLITGIVPTREDGEKVLDIARRTAGVNKVYNELFVGAEYSTRQKAADAWLAAQIQPRLVGDQNAFPLNYLISVINGHVYILGSVATVGEQQHVLHILSTTNGVKQVHDYLQLRQTPETVGETATGAKGWLSKASQQGNAPDPLKTR
jgi:hyperosmotically inducible protein